MDEEIHMGLNGGEYARPVKKDPFELADDVVSDEILWSGWFFMIMT